MGSSNSSCAHEKKIRDISNIHKLSVGVRSKEDDDEKKRREESKNMCSKKQEQWQNVNIKKTYSIHKHSHTTGPGGYKYKM